MKEKGLQKQFKGDQPGCATSGPALSKGEVKEWREQEVSLWSARRVHHIHFQDILPFTFPFEAPAHLTLTLSTLAFSMNTENRTISNALKCPPGKAAVSHDMNR